MSQPQTRIDAEEAAAESAAVGYAYLFGGVVVGFVSILVTLMIEGLAIAFAQAVTGADACGDGFSTAATLGLIVFGFVTSLLIGCTLYRWRRFVGGHGDPEDAEFAAMIRKRFTYGAMVTYCALAPLGWLFILAAANCAGNH